MLHNELTEWLDIGQASDSYYKFWLMKSVFHADLLTDDKNATILTRIFILLEEEEAELDRKLAVIDTIIFDDEFWRSKTHWKIDGIKQMQSIRRSGIFKDAQWQKIQAIANQRQKKDYSSGLFLPLIKLIDHGRQGVTRVFYDYVVQGKPETFLPVMNKVSTEEKKIVEIPVDQGPSLFQLVHRVPSEIFLAIIQKCDDKAMLSFLLTSKSFSTILQRDDLYKVLLKVLPDQQKWINFSYRTAEREYYRKKWLGKAHLKISFEKKMHPILLNRTLVTGNSIAFKKVNPEKVLSLTRHDDFFELMKEVSRFEPFITVNNMNSKGPKYRYNNSALKVFDQENTDKFSLTDDYFIFFMLPYLIKANAVECFIYFLRLHFARLNLRSSDFPQPVSFPELTDIIREASDPWFTFNFVLLIFERLEKPEFMKQFYLLYSDEKKVFLNNLSEDIYKKILKDEDLADDVARYCSNPVFIELYNKQKQLDKLEQELFLARMAYEDFHKKEGKLMPYKKASEMKTISAIQNTKNEKLLHAQIKLENFLAGKEDKIEENELEQKRFCM